MKKAIKVLEREIAAQEEKAITQSNVKKTPLEVARYLETIKEEVEGEDS